MLDDDALIARVEAGEPGFSDLGPHFIRLANQSFREGDAAVVDRLAAWATRPSPVGFRVWALECLLHTAFWHRARSALVESLDSESGRAAIAALVRGGTIGPNFVPLAPLDMPKEDRTTALAHLDGQRPWVPASVARQEVAEILDRYVDRCIREADGGWDQPPETG